MSLLFVVLKREMRSESCRLTFRTEPQPDPQEGLHHEKGKKSCLFPPVLGSVVGLGSCAGQQNLKNDFPIRPPSLPLLTNNNSCKLSLQNWL